MIDAERLSELVAAPETAEDVRTYFGVGAPDVVPPAFTGAWFERLRGGGDQEAVASALTAEDLVAVEMLSVQVPAATALELLHGQPGRDIGNLLAMIPAKVALQDGDAEQHVAAGSPADVAWSRLRALPGVGWVVAGKLLARKRPHLIPVYDAVVKCFLGAPDAFWTDLRTALRAENNRLVREIESLRSAAGVPPDVSVIRILDVAVWMHHRDDHRSGRCPRAEGPAADRAG